MYEFYRTTTWSGPNLDWIKKGDLVVLAPCLQRLCAELARHRKYRNLTNLGEVGDARHVTETFFSDHNPFVLSPDKSRHLIRAIDLGGDVELLMRLRDKLNRLYAHKDDRLHVFGYTKGPDSLITTWRVNPRGKVHLHTDPGDEGHLHISITQADGYHPSPKGWVVPLGSRRPWGISPFIPARVVARVKSKIG